VILSVPWQAHVFNITKRQKNLFFLCTDNKVNKKIFIDFLKTMKYRRFLSKMCLTLINWFYIIIEILLNLILEA